MKNKVILIILSCFPLINTFAQYQSKCSFFEGRITSNLDSIKLVVGYWPDCLSGLANQPKYIHISVDIKGKFQFSLPANGGPYRIKLGDAYSGNMLFSNVQIVEPGDSVSLDAIIHDRTEMSDSNFMTFYSGINSEKYVCMQAIKLINDKSILNMNVDVYDKIRLSDSVLGLKLKVLDRFRTNLSPEIYQIIMADIVGESQYTLLYLCFSDLLYGAKPDSLKSERFKIFNDIVSFNLSVSKENLILSEWYTQYLYLKEKLKLIFLRNTKNVNWKEFYTVFRNKYTGILREKLLAYCLLNDIDMAQFFGSIDSNAFGWALDDALKIIHTPYFKKTVENLKSIKGKGAIAFNFILSSDSTNKKVSLSDLKGKVVLLDIWAYQCTGCYRFSTVFHEKVFPLFKDNPNFKVVSIMADESSKMAYLHRLRGEGGVKYTSPDYINLFAGKGDSMGRAMCAHYNIDLFPTILIIAKDGKVFSSTIPFFDNGNSPNVKKLISLIYKALGKS